MVNSFTLFTISGLKARILRVLLATPFLLVGLGMIAIGIEELPAEAGLILLGIGGILGFIGGYQYLKAVRKDTLSLTISESKGRMD